MMTSNEVIEKTSDGARRFPVRRSSAWIEFHEGSLHRVAELKKSGVHGEHGLLHLVLLNFKHLADDCQDELQQEGRLRTVMIAWSLVSTWAI
jgi:hypothetical protein